MVQIQKCLGCLGSVHSDQRMYWRFVCFCDMSWMVLEFRGGLGVFVAFSIIYRGFK